MTQPRAITHPTDHASSGAVDPRAMPPASLATPVSAPRVTSSPDAAASTPETDTPYEPVILGFTCNWCSYRAADLAGTARTKYPPNVRLVRLMCSGRLDPTFVLQAFADGADAVMVTGCWPEDCHYRVQNIKALRRFLLLRRVLESMGIEPERFIRFYASAAEGTQLAAEFSRVTEQVRALGPLHWPDRRDRDHGDERPPAVAAMSAAVESSPREPVQ